MEELLSIELNQQEVNLILQMLDKTQVIGINAMQVALALNAKIRQAIAQVVPPVGPTEKK
jgi:hypothetical protein